MDNCSAQRLCHHARFRAYGVSGASEWKVQVSAIA
jgi:hypothetical protein